MSFNFGSTPKTTGGFTLNMNPATTTASLTGFAFGSGAGDAKALNKPAGSFGTPTTQTTLSFGGTTPSTGIGTTSASTGLPGAAATATTTLNFGPTSTSATPLSFGAPAPTSTQSFLLGSTAATAASTPQFGFGSKTSAPSSTTSFTPILGSTTTSSGISLGSSLTTSSAAPVSLSFGVSSTPATSTITPATTTSLGNLPTSAATLTSTTSLVPSTGSMTFAQLEDSINKWTIDLEEQGKFFINQAKQLNAWDSLLISNGEKILNLNGSIERVKQQQQQLDQELDFVLAQQKELEELIRPLEKELVDIPVTDIDRNQMYQFAEIIDSQLKQMSDDLKEIIENINDSNKDEEVNNPVSQISRILNAHMNSLQWVDRNTAQINAHLEQITKIQDSNRRNFALNHSFNHSFNM